jgi:transketolase
MAEIATALFTRHLKFDAADPTWPDRDRVVLSNGHGSMLLYALLHLSGYQRMGIEEVSTFRDFGSHCEGHPERDPASGIEVTTGPLGQGIGNAFGMAVAEAYLNARFGDGIVDHRTYAFVGDGCLQEGIGQEMISLAGHLCLGKLTLLWDDNRITDDGATDLPISEDVAARCRVRVGMWWKSMGTMSKPCRRRSAKPTPAFVAGLPHGDRRALRACRAARAAPGCLRKTPRQRERSMAARRSGACASTPVRCRPPLAQRERGTSLAAVPAPPRRVRTRDRGELAGCARCCAATNATADGAKGGIISPTSTHRSAARAFDPCADLEAPTSHKRGLTAFTADDHSGSYVHCGVREHVMGSMANGMAAHGGVLPLSVTYLAFADYQRPAMRMAALMGLPVKFVFSHDSIGIGKNGPTHQPVEVLASLRAMPNMLVMRPADAVEAAECWEAALAHSTGPVSLVFARQSLPLVRTMHTPGNLARRGGYVLHEAACGPRQVTLLATGSEVLLAVQAREALEAEGIATAVVSLPCWELFNGQDAAYRQSVLGDATQGVRVGIEAAVRQGWDAYLGIDGGFVGMTGFGASGPADALYKLFNITPEAVVAEARRLLAA